MTSLGTCWFVVKLKDGELGSSGVVPPGARFGAEPIIIKLTNQPIETAASVIQWRVSVLVSH